MFFHASDLLRNIHAKLGWETKASDSFATKKLRTTIITALLAYDDKNAIAEAHKMFSSYARTGESLHPDFRSAVFQVRTKLARLLKRVLHTCILLKPKLFDRENVC